MNIKTLCQISIFPHPLHIFQKHKCKYYQPATSYVLVKYLRNLRLADTAIFGAYK